MAKNEILSVFEKYNYILPADIKNTTPRDLSLILKYCDFSFYIEQLISSGGNGDSSYYATFYCDKIGVICFQEIKPIISFENVEDLAEYIEDLKYNFDRIKKTLLIN